MISNISSNYTAICSLFKFSKKSNQLSRKILLRMAKNKKPKPNQKTKIGRLLCKITNPNNKYYDKEFTKKIKRLMPDWLETSANLSKKKLLEMSKKGEDKPSIKTSLGRKFYRYVTKGELFDPNFVEKIRKSTPNWLSSRKNNKKIKQRIIINLLKKNKKLKPSDLDKLEGLGPTGRSIFYCYMKTDDDFYRTVRKLRPELSFLIIGKTKKPRTFHKKNKIISLLKNKTAKCKLPKEYIMAIKRYIDPKSSSFDAEFASKFKKLAPNWPNRSSKGSIYDKQY